MFIPVWIFTVFFVLYFLRIVVSMYFRNKLINSSPDKALEAIKSFDMISVIRDKKIHVYLTEEGKFDFELLENTTNE